MTNIVQIRVGKYKTGIIGLDDALKEIAEGNRHLTDQEIGTLLLEKLSRKNYIPSKAADLYQVSFLKEYKKFIGLPVSDNPFPGLEIKVLGAGCPSCDQLEQNLMALIEEIGIEADLEHIRDFKRISQYGVMALPAVVINGQVKVLGSVPSKAKLKEFILEVQTAIKPETSP